MEEGRARERETTAIGEHVRVHTRRWTREKERRKWGEEEGETGRETHTGHVVAPME